MYAFDLCCVTFYSIHFLGSLHFKAVSYKGSISLHAGKERVTLLQTALDERLL